MTRLGVRAQVAQARLLAHLPPPPPGRGYLATRTVPEAGQLTVADMALCALASLAGQDVQDVLAVLPVGRAPASRVATVAARLRLAELQPAQREAWLRHLVPDPKVRSKVRAQAAVPLPATEAS